MSPRPTTRRELIDSGYQRQSVKDEMRANMIRALLDGRDLFPGIVGYGETVIPALINAVLAGHDLILLGLRGQAKSRILRALVNLLDDEIPVIAGTPLHDDPMEPVSPLGKRLEQELGDGLPVAWIPRDARYNEKLATPEVTMADLIGDIDPVMAAARAKSIVDDEAIAYGIIPRTNRGIFAVNELPDLPPRIQVALLDVMEERDLQIRGFPVRIPLDIQLVFSANPEDYTRRGNLITPLRDRIAAQIHTHYPEDLLTGIQITRQEAKVVRRDGPEVLIPEAARELVEEVARVARVSDWIDQSSGVSARLTIALLEAVVANAERRALIAGSTRTALRVTDFFQSTAAIAGKVELVFEGEREGPEKVASHLIGQAARRVFDRRFPEFFSSDEEDSVYTPLSDWFRNGGRCETNDVDDDGLLEDSLMDIPGMKALLDDHFGDLEMGAQVFGAELVLEGLHQHSALAKDRIGRGSSYSDMVSGMWEGMNGGGERD